jgi:hypothetical protein
MCRAKDGFKWKLRRRVSFLKVNVWATDTFDGSDNGRVMRGKIVEEVNRVVKQFRSKPNETLYDLTNLGSSLHVCFIKQN